MEPEDRRRLIARNKINLLEVEGGRLTNSYWFWFGFGLFWFGFCLVCFWFGFCFGFCFGLVWFLVWFWFVLVWFWFVLVWFWFWFVELENLPTPVAFVSSLEHLPRVNF